MTNRVFVLYSDKSPAMPCHPARARELLRKGKAAVFRIQPFTIILQERETGESQHVELKADPGSKITGLALVAHFPRGSEVVWAANLHHRGHAIRARLERRAMLRRGRRGRKTRYRQPRFLNRTRPKGWLPPSLMSRVNNVKIWTNRLIDRAPITSIAVETVRFDMQVMRNPEISGVEYQRGTLWGYEQREYLLEKWNRTCAYCDKKDVPLEVEHILPCAKGGSDATSNLTLSCVPCNQAKGTKLIEQFLADQPERLARINRQRKAPLKDAAAVNATRYAIGDALKAFGLPVSFWSGGRTKRNRTSQDYPKSHVADAACVGETGACVSFDPEAKPLEIIATGRGQRQTVRTDKYGFPRGKAGRVKRVHGFQTGDLVRLEQPNGKYAGSWTGILAGIRERGSFTIKTATHKFDAAWSGFEIIQQHDGYAYA